jgi:hypothetical protein
LIVALIKIPDRNNLKEETFTLAYGFRGISPSWQGAHDRAERLTSRQARKQKKKGRILGTHYILQCHSYNDVLSPVRTYLPQFPHLLKQCHQLGNMSLW